MTGAVLAGCAGQGGVRDDGAAPRLTAPTSASPLWPGSTPSAPPSQSAGEAEKAENAVPSLAPYAPVEGVTVPRGGLRDVPVRTLLGNDLMLPAVVRKMVAADCPRGRCTVRPPVYRDLTGDGRDELIAAIDEYGFQITMVQVYAAYGATVRPLLAHRGQLGLTGETQGRELVLTATSQDGQVTSRYRWNGERLALVLPGAGPDAGPGTGPGAGRWEVPGEGLQVPTWIPGPPAGSAVPAPADPAPRTTTP